MEFNDFADALCHLKTAIEKYLDAQRARDFCSGGQLPLPNVAINTIAEVLDERIHLCEKQIIELAVKLIDSPAYQPAKKKK